MNKEELAKAVIKSFLNTINNLSDNDKDTLLNSLFPTEKIYRYLQEPHTSPLSVSLLTQIANALPKQVIGN